MVVGGAFCTALDPPPGSTIAELSTAHYVGPYPRATCSTLFGLFAREVPRFYYLVAPHSSTSVPYKGVSASTGHRVAGYAVLVPGYRTRRRSIGVCTGP
eukprot:3938662-Rhodomonas_salina.1